MSKENLKFKKCGKGFWVANSAGVFGYEITKTTEAIDPYFAKAICKNSDPSKDIELGTFNTLDDAKMACDRHKDETVEAATKHAIEKTDLKPFESHVPYELLANDAEFATVLLQPKSPSGCQTVITLQGSGDKKAEMEEMLRVIAVGSDPDVIKVFEVVDECKAIIRNPIVGCLDRMKKSLAKLD